MTEHMMRTTAINIFFLVILICLLGAPAVEAQSGGPYELTWTSVDAGGGAMTGVAYSLVSGIAQPEPGSTQSGGGYSLNGGIVDPGSSNQTASGGRPSSCRWSYAEMKCGAPFWCAALRATLVRGNMRTTRSARPITLTLLVAAETIVHLRIVERQEETQDA